jgi:hypothetical protein
MYIYIYVCMQSSGDQDKLQSNLFAEKAATASAEKAATAKMLAWKKANPPAPPPPAPPPPPPPTGSSSTNKQSGLTGAEVSMEPEPEPESDGSIASDDD